MKPAVLLCMVRGIDVIAEDLLERADLDLITLHDLSSAILVKKDIPHRRFDAYFSDDLRARALRATEGRAAPIVQHFYTDAMRAEWPQFDQTCWAELRGHVFKTLSTDFVEEILAADMLRRCVCDTDLRLIIVPDDYTRDTRNVIASGRRLGIPSLHLLHGYPYQTQNLHNVVAADAVAAFSDHSKKIFESFGMPANRITVTGNPLWDVYTAPPMPSTRERICAENGLDPNRPIIPYVLTAPHRFSAVSAVHPLYHLQTAEVVLKAFITLSQRHPEWQFLFRPHPVTAKAVERFETQAAEAGLSDFRIDASPFAYDCICMADVLLCTHSNMGIEALFFGKPVVNVATDRIGGPVFREGIGPLYQESDAILNASSEEEIAACVEAALLDPTTEERLLEQRPATLERFNAGNDGRATERFCRLILDMVAESPACMTPVDRYPEYEPALAEAVPESAHRIQVVGRAARHVADAIECAHPGVHIALDETIETLPEEAVDAVVFADPIAARIEAHGPLRAARRRLGAQGVLIASFRHGADAETIWGLLAGRWAPPRQGAESALSVGEYTRKGLEIVLSRCGFEIETESDVGIPLGEPSDVEGWVVRARPRTEEPGPLAQQRSERKARADEHNAKGEKLFAAGDVRAASTCFAEAIDECRSEAIYYSNLGAALHALGESEHAWNQTRHALHLDPNHQTVRANMRLVAQTLGCEEEAEETLSLYGADA